MKIVDLLIFLQLVIHSQTNTLKNNNIKVKNFIQDDQNGKKNLKNEKVEDEPDEEIDNRKYLDYEILDALMQKVSENVVKIKSQRKEIVLEKLQRMTEEYNMDIIHMRDYFNHQTSISYEQGLKIIEALKDKILKTQLTLFNLTEILVDKIKEDKLDIINQSRKQIDVLLQKFPPPKSTCDLISSCDTCIKDQNCIWCSESHMCHDGNIEDGAIFWTCPFTLKESCTTPKSQYFFEVPATDVVHHKFENFANDPNLPLEQKQYITKKQQEMLGFKHKIEKQRISLKKMNNITVIIRSRKAMLVSYFKQISSPEFQEDDSDYEEYFLDVVDIDDIGAAIAQLEDEVKDLKEEDKENMKDQLEEEQLRKEEALEARRSIYEGESVRRNQAPQPRPQSKKKVKAEQKSGPGGQTNDNKENEKQVVEKEEKRPPPPPKAEPLDLSKSSKKAPLKEVLEKEEQNKKKKFFYLW